jgi:drug/metabolite transporter (DMT)-like permease
MIPTPLIAAILLCLSSLAFTLNDTTTKFLLADYDVASIILIRSLMALPILYLFHVRSTGRTVVWSTRIWLHALRGALGLIAAWLYIASLRQLTVAQAAVILFLTPVIITLMSRLVLRENVSLRTWLSVCLCFLGVIVAINPGVAQINSATLLVGLSSLFYAANAINARFIPTEENLWTISFLGALFSALFVLPFALEHWRGLQSAHLIQFAGAAAFSSMGIGISAVAYRMTSPAFLAPFAYSGLVWSMAVTWLFWGIHPGINALIGTLIILGSVAFIIRPGHALKNEPGPTGQKNCSKETLDDPSRSCHP